MKDFVRMMTSLAMTLVMIWLLFAFFLGVKMAPNDDMLPKIGAGDVVIYYRIDKDPALNDVMMIKKNDTDYLGRVVACGGDEVNITDEGALYVNGNQVIEDQIFYQTQPYEGFVDYPLRLATDECFILADSRDGGEDSRYYGAVKKKEIKGTVIGLFRKNRI